MKELQALVTDLSNISKLTEKAGMDLDRLANRYYDNDWLADKLMEIENDLHHIVGKLGQLKTIYDFKGGE